MTDTNTMIARVAVLLGDESRRDLWQYAQLLLVREMAARDTERDVRPRRAGGGGAAPAAACARAS